MPVSGPSLPGRLEGPDRLQLRRLLRADAEILSRAVSESLAHLRPWMEWAANEPLALEERRALLARWEEQWSRGEDMTFGIFVDGRLAGTCGLHRRIGAGGLEIGYWVHPAFTRRGVATSTCDC